MTGFRARNGTACADTASPACRWADVEASEGESDEEWAMAIAPPTTDDSYRGAPLAALEDSCSGLNSRLKCAAELEAGPQDFAFLLKSTQKVAPDSEEAADLRQSALEKAQRELEASTSSPATGSLSADAPEFVPTLTMVCPLVGICSVASTDEASFVTPQNHFAPDPYSPELLRLSPKQGRHRGGVGRKRNTPPAIQAPDRKRTKSEERRQSIPEEAKPNKSQMEMPEATEEEWQQRIKKRELAVTLGKRSHEYQRFQQLKMNEEREEGEPLTPDPRDRSVSKRKWKHDIDEWRKQLLKRYGDEGQGSVASTEEWLSVFTSTTEEADGTATTVDGDEEGKDEGDDAASV